MEDNNLKSQLRKLALTKVRSKKKSFFSKGQKHENMKRTIRKLSFKMRETGMLKKLELHEIDMITDTYTRWKKTSSALQGKRRE